ncbi:hypothetical protein [Klebsiella michiganensis]|uniref:hypothetical protein n=1 Tax=Klebsiella michiganensis TaxID=1134687 RepID=UPI0007DAB7C4|nr:hypothetical protein [Klebsiella michiganensis]
MTDITELAQSLKRRAASANEFGESLYVKADDILALVEALEHYKSREERVTNLVHDNSKSWNALYQQVEAKDKRNAELVEALESETRICATWRKTAEANSEKLEKAQHEARVDWEAAASLNVENQELKRRIAELESRTVTVKMPDIMPPEAAPAHYWGSGESMAYADGYNKSAADLKTSFAQACSSAGVNVEFE